MCPRIAHHGISHRRFRHAEFFCKKGNRLYPVTEIGPGLQHQGVREFCRSVSASKQRSSFCLTVRHVLGVSAFEQVIRVRTKFLITMMTYAQIARVFTVNQHEDETVDAVTSERAVTIFVDRAHPTPARAEFLAVRRHRSVSENKTPKHFELTLTENDHTTSDARYQAQS